MMYKLLLIDDLSELITVKLKNLDDCNMKHIKFHGIGARSETLKNTGC